LDNLLQIDKVVTKIRIIALFWLIFIAAFIGGICIYSSQRWPYPLIKQIEDYIRGAEGEQTNLIEKISNDLNFKPARLISEANTRTRVGSEHRELTGLPLNPRRAKPKIFLSENAPLGYRVIYGTFDFEKHLSGAILLDPTGRVANVWQVSQEDVPWHHDADANVFPHGFEIASDGSIVTAYDGGTSMTKYDYCGNIVWRIQGGFHHSIAFEEKDAVWSWGNNGKAEAGGFVFNKVDYKTGDVLKRFSVQDVINANMEIDIFGIRQIDSFEGSEWHWDGGGPWHINDIDPLPMELEKYYSGFKAGDLLVSFRSCNLIFVVDQNTLAVKWWRQGLTRRQHDPDWNDHGSITIFNNNMHRKYSHIVELYPLTQKSRLLVDGAKYNFYTWQQGKHQFLPNNGVLITSPQQGRVFEVDASGNITFEFLNTYSEEKGMLMLSEARFLPLDFFGDLPQCN
jgi:hypothetical protein